MSKRHKHIYDYELEKRWTYMELQRQFVMLILILLMYEDRTKSINYKILCTTKKKNPPSYTGGGKAFSAESELVEKPVFIQTGNEGDVRVSITNGIDKGFQAPKTNQSVEKGSIIYSTNKKNLPSNIGGGITFSAESELAEMPVSIQTSDEDDVRISFTDCIGRDLQDLKTDQSVENNRIIYSTKKKNSTSNAGGGITISEESELVEMPVFIQTGDAGNTRVNFTDATDNVYQEHIIEQSLEENNNSNYNNILENKNTSQEQTVIFCSNVTVYNAETVACSPDDNLSLRESPFVISVPVVLSNTNIEVFVEALTRFPEQVFKIKDMDKKVIIKECRLIPGTNKLFIDGIIVENVEYANEKSVEQDSNNGKVKKVIFNIPFKASEVVTFLSKPFNLEQYSDVEVELLNTGGNDTYINEKNSVNQEILNRCIFGELNSIEILETDIQEEIKFIQSSFFDMHTFEKIRKKIVVKIGLSLLQNQKIFIDSSTLNTIEGNI